MDGLFVCMYVCMYSYVYIYISIYIYKTHICVYVCVYVYIYIYICIYVFMYVCVYVCIYFICMYIYFFLCCCCGCCCCTCFGTMNLTSFLPPLYLDTPDTRRNIWYPWGNAKPHEHRNNPRAYIPIKTHIHTTIKKSPLPTKPMQIFIPQIHG